MVILQGTCKKFITVGKVRTPDCTGKLLNTEYADSRVGFYFVTADGMPLTFSARGEKQVKADANTAIAPVDMVLISAKGKTDKIPAVGTCKFTNPYRGVPAPVECTADTAQGRYEAAFLSDGASRMTRPLTRSGIRGDDVPGDGDCGEAGGERREVSAFRGIGTFETQWRTLKNLLY